MSGFNDSVAAGIFVVWHPPPLQHAWNGMYLLFFLWPRRSVVQELNRTCELEVLQLFCIFAPFMIISLLSGIFLGVFANFTTFRHFWAVFANFTTFRHFWGVFANFTTFRHFSAVFANFTTFRHFCRPLFPNITIFRDIFCTLSQNTAVFLFFSSLSQNTHLVSCSCTLSQNISFSCFSYNLSQNTTLLCFPGISSQNIYIYIYIFFLFFAYFVAKYSFCCSSCTL